MLERPSNRWYCKHLASPRSGETARAARREATRVAGFAHQVSRDRGIAPQRQVDSPVRERSSERGAGDATTLDPGDGSPRTYVVRGGARSKHVRTVRTPVTPLS